MKTAAQYCLLSMAVMILFSTLSGQDGYRSVTVWVQGVSPFEEGDDRGSFPVLGDLRRNRVGTVVADSFRNRGSRVSSPTDLYGSRFCSSFRTSAILIWVKENLERLGRVAAGGGGGLLAEVGVARQKAWPAVEKCLLKFSIIMDLSVETVFPSLSAVGSWGGGALVLHGLYRVP